MADNYDGSSGGVGGSTPLDAGGSDYTGSTAGGDSGNIDSGGATTGTNGGYMPNNDWQKYIPQQPGNTGNPVTNKLPVLDKTQVTGKVPVIKKKQNYSNNNLQAQPYQFQTITYEPIMINPVLAGKTDILASKGIVTGNPRLQSKTGRPASLPTSQTKNTGDCTEKSYFYIVGKDSEKPDNAAKEFFNIMNARAGGIFFLCPDDGKVLLSKGKDPEGVKVTKTTSRILAKTINDGIQGGVVYNGAPKAHSVYCRVFDPGNDDDANDSVYMEEFKTGEVDLADERNINNEQMSKKDGGAIIQAAFMGHFIRERFATPDYEVVKKAMSKKDLIPYHLLGIKRECEIIREMARIRAEFDTRESEDMSFGATNLPAHLYYYPNKDGPVVKVSVICKRKEGLVSINLWSVVERSVLEIT